MIAPLQWHLDLSQGCDPFERNVTGRPPNLQRPSSGSKSRDTFVTSHAMDFLVFLLLDHKQPKSIQMNEISNSLPHSFTESANLPWRNLSEEVHPNWGMAPDPDNSVQAVNSVEGHGDCPLVCTTLQWNVSALLLHWLSPPFRQQYPRLEEQAQRVVRRDRSPPRPAMLCRGIRVLSAIAPPPTDITKTEHAGARKGTVVTYHDWGDVPWSILYAWDIQKRDTSAGQNDRRWTRRLMLLRYDLGADESPLWTKPRRECHAHIQADQTQRRIRRPCSFQVQSVSAEAAAKYWYPWSRHAISRAFAIVSVWKAPLGCQMLFRYQLPPSMLRQRRQHAFSRIWRCSLRYMGHTPIEVALKPSYTPNQALEGSNRTSASLLQWRGISGLRSRSGDHYVPRRESTDRKRLARLSTYDVPNPCTRWGAAPRHDV